MIERRMDKDKSFTERIEKFSYIICVLFQNLKLTKDDVKKLIDGLAIPHRLTKSDDIPEFEFLPNLVNNVVIITK